MTARMPALGQSLLLKLLAVMSLSVSMAMATCHKPWHHRFSVVSEGRLPAQSPVQVIQGMRTAADCTLACVMFLEEACLSLSFSQEHGECRHYSTFDPDDVNVTSPGHEYLTRCPAEATWKGQICSTSGDCSQTANAECRYNSCQCVAGYHFYPCFGSCVEKCPYGYGNGYYGVRDYGTPSEYEVYYSGVTPEQCWQKCRADQRCRTFEVKDDTCQLSDVTKLELPPSEWIAFPGGTHNTRDCA